MSQYYAGYEVLGLLLIDGEIDAFKRAYIEKNLAHYRREQGRTREDMEEIAEEWITTNETLYVDEETHTGELELIYVSVDQCDGMILYPASRYNKEPQYDGKGYRAHNCLIIAAEYQPSTIQQLAGDPFYKDYDELLAEFKNKLQEILPNNFPWDERIGDFQYACYA